MVIEKKKISELIAAPYNARRSTAKQEKDLKSSLKKFGAVEPIVFNKKTGFIVGGHFRVRELKKLGYKEIECVIVDLDENDEKELNIRLNANTGEWDWEMLANEWDDAKLADWGLDLPDMSEKVLEAEEDDFDIPDGGIETDIVPGDLFEIGPHRLLCGDSTDADAVARLMNGELADMVFTDPPYGYKYESNYYKKGNPFGMLINDDQIVDFLPSVELSTKENAGIYICGSHQTIHKWRELIDRYFAYKNLIVWKKNNWSMGDLSGAYAGQHELIIFSHKGRIELEGGRDTDIWEFDRERADVHPTQKPVELVSFAIKKTIKLGMIVIDYFLGSGSTMVAAHQLGRKCYGMELDPKYCQVIVDRMRKLDPGIEIKRNGQPYKID